MKKIGFLIYDDSLTGGAEKIAKKLAEELSTEYEVYVISLFQERNDSNKTYKYNHFVVSKETVSITKNIFKLSKVLKNYLNENKIEQLYSITAGVNTVAIKATKGTSIKTIYCEHSNLENKTYGKKHELRQYLGAKQMDKIVTLTNRDRNNFIKFFKVPEDKVICIPNWFEHCNNKEQAYKDDSKKIISVGRLEKVKGYDMLIKVAKEVYKYHPDWKWDIYGEGTCRVEIAEQISNSNLDSFIELKGNVNNLNSIYGDYAFLVMTSYYEGIPLSLLEAQDFKLPIISFDCPTGPSEIIENNTNGFLIPCYNIENMASKICELIDNKDLRIKFSNNSNINEDKYDKNEILKKWKNLISTI